MATAASIAQSFVSRVSTAPRYRLGNSVIRMLANGVQTLNRYSLTHETWDEGVGSYTTINAQDTVFYLVSGRCTFNVGDLHDVHATEGDIIFVPQFTEYSFTVSTSGTELLRFSTPAGPEQVLLGLSSPLTSESQPAAPPLPPRSLIDHLNHQYSIATPGGLSLHDPFTPSCLITHAPNPTLTTVRPIVTNSRTAPSYWASPHLPERWTMLITAPTFTCAELLFPLGTVVPLISYTGRDEIYYVLSGRASVLQNSSVERDLGPGDFVCMARGTVWAVKSESDVLTMLVLQIPGGLFEALIPFMAREVKEQGEEGLPPKGWRLERDMDPSAGMGIMLREGVVAVRGGGKPFGED